MIQQLGNQMKNLFDNRNSNQPCLIMLTPQEIHGQNHKTQKHSYCSVHVVELKVT